MAELEKKINHISEELKCEQHNAKLSQTALQSKLSEEEKLRKQKCLEADSSIKSIEKQLVDCQAR